MKVLDAVIDDDGQVQILEPIQLPSGQRLLITVLDDGGQSRDAARLAGCLHQYAGKPVTIEEMREAIEEGGAGL